MPCAQRYFLSHLCGGERIIENIVERMAYTAFVHHHIGGLEKQDWRISEV
jgi:hypothetical protein